MSNRVVNDKEIIRIIREEWAAIKKSVLNEVSLSQEDASLIPPGLTITDEEGNLYTVVSVGNTSVNMIDNTGTEINVTWDQMGEKGFKIQ